MKSYKRIVKRGVKESTFVDDNSCSTGVGVLSSESPAIVDLISEREYEKGSIAKEVLKASYLSVLDRFCAAVLPMSLLSTEFSSSDLLALIYPSDPIPSTFSSLESYINQFEPALIEEINSGTISSLSSNTSRCIHGTWDLSNLAGPDTTTYIRHLYYTFVHSSAPEEDRSPPPLKHMDLVLFSCIPLSLPLTRDKIKSIPRSAYILALVASGGKKNAQFKVLNDKWLQFVLYANENHKAKFPYGIIPPDSTSVVDISYYVIDNLISSYREFVGIHSISASKIMNYLIQSDERASTPVTEPPREDPMNGDVLLNTPTPPQSPDYDSTLDVGDYHTAVTGIGEALLPKLKQDYNPSQLEAIVNSVERNQQGFTLVQGPPGTGKTFTVLGMLNTLHVKFFNRCYESTIATLLGEEGLRCRQAHANDITPWMHLSLSIPRPRLLVLAPSNVAVDNMIERILETGFTDGSGLKYWPSMLRLGAGGKGTRVRVVSLEESTDQILSIEKDAIYEIKENLMKTVRKLIQDIFNLQTLLINLRAGWNAAVLPSEYEVRVDPATAVVYWVDHKNRTTSSIPPKFDEKCQIRSHLTYNTLPEYYVYSKQLAHFVDQMRHVSLQEKRLVLRYKMAAGQGSTRNLIENSLIDDSHIVFTTLNSSGQSCLDSSHFDTIVIDEAGQAVEPSTLIPLRLNCVKYILVGDPMQLSATTFSNKSRRINYDRSLFERLMETGFPVHMLNTQYRMLPPINAFPSKAFYHDRLLCSDSVKDPSNCPDYIDYLLDFKKDTKTFRFPPFVFFDLLTSKDELKDSNSRINIEEAKLCTNVLKALVECMVSHNCKLGSIGIITPYQEQLSELKRLIPRINWSMICSSTPDIELNTVDAFQGREKDVILITCVRANDEGAIGFLSDTRRMNVALTRSKYGLYVIGHAGTLRSNRHWGALIEHAESTNALLVTPKADSNVVSLLKNARPKLEVNPVVEIQSIGSAYRGKRKAEETEFAVNKLIKVVESGEIVEEALDSLTTSKSTAGPKRHVV